MEISGSAAAAGADEDVWYFPPSRSICFIPMPNPTEPIYGRPVGRCWLQALDPVRTRDRSQCSAVVDASAKLRACTSATYSSEHIRTWCSALHRSPARPVRRNGLAPSPFRAKEFTTTYMQLGLGLGLHHIPKACACGMHVPSLFLPALPRNVLV